MHQERKPKHPGIAVRHRTRCAARHGGRCNCQPSYQAQAWSPRDNTPIRKTFPTLAAARAWRSDAQTALRRGTLRAPTQTTLREAADTWLAGVKTSAVRNRSGDPYKPSVIRGYEASLRLRVLPEFGAKRLSALTRNDVQDYADRLVAQGLDASTVRNALMPLRAIYRRAVARGDIAINPTRELELPAVRGRRERIATPDEARQLIAALPERDRALWATALYAGLRRGELQALDWQDTDLNTALIHVRRSWDRKAGPIEVKTTAGKRKVPLPSTLRALLLEHHLHSGRPDAGLVFTNAAGRPFDSSTVVDRARRAWTGANLEPIGLHECRHTYASLMIAAGVNAKALSTYLGHATIAITLDRYGHLMPGNETQAGLLLDGLLDRASAS
jgi:integrase